MTHKLHVTLRLLVAAIVCGVLSPAAARAAPAPPPSPTATMDVGTVSLGDPVLVRGAGWPPRSLAHVELCGNEALNGSADCDLPSALDAGVSIDGYFSTLIHALRPPSPCPCVVFVTDADTYQSLKLPLAIVGAPTTPGQLQVLPDISQVLQVSSMHVKGGPWTSWFGSGANRTLVFTVKNVGAVNVHDAQMALTFGKGTQPSGFVAAPPLPPLQPGQTVTEVAHIPVNSLAIGKYTIAGQIAGFGKPLTFRTHVSMYPWALLVLVLFIPALMLIRRRLRRRRRRRAPVPAVAELSAGTTMDGAEPFVEPIPIDAAAMTLDELEVHAAHLARHATMLAAEAELAAERAAKAALAAEVAKTAFDQARESDMALADRARDGQAAVSRSTEA